jgi:integrase/recombinase XerD
LILYRRHNATRCSAVETNAPCSNKRKGCPIWVRGTAPDGNYVEKSLRSLTGKIARDWEDARQTLRDWEAIGKPPAPVAARTTIATWKSEYTALATASKLSSETLRKYKHLFAQLEAYATDKGLRFVDEFDLQVTTDFRLSWTDGALSTAKKLERLRSIMKLAVEREWLSKNFAAMLKAPKVKQSPTLPFTNDEMKKIVKAARDNQRVYTFILAMRSSGLRISDVTKLAVSSLDKNNRLKLYQAKTGEYVSILLDQTVADALRAVVPLNRNKDYFFWTGESKLPAAVSNWRKRIADVFTDAGIVNGHTHRFRDTFAVALLEKGATIENVSRLLGHTSIKITERHYSPWVQSRQDALDAALVGANGWLAEAESAPKDNVRQMNRKG